MPMYRLEIIFLCVEIHMDIDMYRRMNKFIYIYVYANIDVHQERERAKVGRARELCT